MATHTSIMCRLYHLLLVLMAGIEFVNALVPQNLYCRVSTRSKPHACSPPLALAHPIGTSSSSTRLFSGDGDKYYVYGKEGTSRPDNDAKNNEPNRETYTFYGKVAPILSRREQDQRVRSYRKNRSLLYRKRKRRFRTKRRALAKLFRSLRGRTFDILFNEIDTNQDGMISREELREFSSLARSSSSSLENPQSVNGTGESDKKELGAATEPSVLSHSSSPSGSIAVSEIPSESNDSDDDQCLISPEDVAGVVDESEFNLLDVNGNGCIDQEDLDEVENAIEVELDDDLSQLEPLERQSFRLEGFDPYILVSVLTAGESFDVLTGYEAKWEEMAAKTSIMELTQQDWFGIALLITGAASTLLGSYAAVTFSLTVLYGKTAIGLDKDDAYYKFLETTGLQRFRAFKAFTVSLGLFFVLVVLEIYQKSPGVLRIPLAAMTIAFLYFGNREYQFIIDSAGPIFAPKAIVPEDEGKEQ